MPTTRHTTPRSRIRPGGTIGPAAEPTPEELSSALDSYLHRDAPLTAAAARALLEAAIGAVAPLDGAERDPDTVSRVATHEAAHAAVGRALHAAGEAAPVESTALETTRSGSTHYSAGYTSRTASLCRLLAGGIAERLAYGRALGHGDDLTRAAALLADAPDPRAMVHAAVSRAEWLLRSAWHEVQAVAAGLRRAGALRAEHIDTLACTAPPAPVAGGLDTRDLARLLAASGDGDAALRALERMAARGAR